MTLSTGVPFSDQATAEPSPVVQEIAWPRDIMDWFARLEPLPGALFLDSARFDPLLGRYSYLCGDPFETIRSRGGQVQVRGVDGCSFATDGGNPLDVLAQRLGRWSAALLPDLPPFQGGAGGLFSYDLCHHIERLPRPRF